MNRRPVALCCESPKRCTQGTSQYITPQLFITPRRRPSVPLAVPPFGLCVESHERLGPAVPFDVLHIVARENEHSCKSVCADSCRVTRDNCMRPTWGTVVSMARVRQREQMNDASGARAY